MTPLNKGSKKFTHCNCHPVPVKADPRLLKRSIDLIPIENGTKFLVPLTHGFFATIDAEDVYLIEGITWQASKRRSNVAYAMCSGRYPDGTSTNILMHRYILGVHGCEGWETDHIDRNSLNNSRENLRWATRSQNNYNQRTKCNSQTGYKGVKFRPAKYVAYAHHKGKKIYGGEFDDIVDAARAHDRLVIKLHGEFAFLNFPLSDYIDNNEETDAESDG